MSRDIWESMLKEMGYLRVPRALRLRRKELGLTNNEYTILLDYVDYYTYCGSENPYGYLAEVNGMSERTIRRVLSALEKKGLLSRTVKSHGNGRTKGVIFGLEPLAKKLRARVTKSSSTEGGDIVPHVPDSSVPPNTGEDVNTEEESKNSKSARCADAGVRVSGSSPDVDGGAGKWQGPFPEARGFSGYGGGQSRKTDRGNGRPGGKASHSPNAPATGKGDGPPGPGFLFPGRAGEGAELKGASAGKRGKKWKDPYCAARWYNDVFAGMYEKAAGQPVLTGGREYKSAETYFARLRALNPGMPGEGVYRRATDGALFMIESQMEGGVFGWMHKPPDICVLAAQAQSVDYHLRKSCAGGDGAEGGTEGDTVRLSFIEKITEGQHAQKQIARIYDELGGIERALRSRAEEAGPGSGPRQAGPGDKAPEQKAPSGGPRFPRKRGRR